MFFSNLFTISFSVVLFDKKFLLLFLIRIYKTAKLRSPINKLPAKVHQEPATEHSFVYIHASSLFFNKHPAVQQELKGNSMNLTQCLLYIYLLTRNPLCAGGDLTGICAVRNEAG